jgi:hypothetical protein
LKTHTLKKLLLKKIILNETFLKLFAYIQDNLSLDYLPLSDIMVDKKELYLVLNDVNLDKEDKEGVG